MHSLAIELKRLGFIVTGSDDVIYEPSKSSLIENDLFPQKLGWYEENIKEDLDFIVLGMHAKSDNPEYLSPENSALLPFQIDICTCIPDPLSPFTGLGINVAVFPNE